MFGIHHQIQTVIQTEGPLSEPVLHRKIAAAWSVPRITQKFTEHVDGIIRRLNPVTNSTQNRKFFWASAADTDMRFFRTNDIGRRPEEICKEEFAVAAMYIMQNALSIGQDDLIRETARFFGFTMFPGATVRISHTISMLVSQGKIIITSCQVADIPDF